MAFLRGATLLGLALLGLTTQAVGAVEGKTWLTDSLATAIEKDPDIERSTKLSHLMFPGSHDAGCIKDKFQYHNDETTTLFSKVNWETQSLGIKGQMDKGARFFDLRFSKYTGGSADTSFVEQTRVYHGDMWPIKDFSISLKEVRRDILTFINGDQRGGGKEILFLRVKLAKGMDKKQFYEEFLGPTEVEEGLGSIKDHAIDPPRIYKGSPHSSIGGMTLADVYAQGKQNKPRVFVMAYEKPDEPGWAKKIAGKLHIVDAPVPSAVKVEAIRTSLANPDLGKKIWSYYDFVTGEYSGSTKDDEVTGGQWKNLKKYRAELAKDKKKQEQPKMFGWWQTYTGFPRNDVIANTKSKFGPSRADKFKAIMCAARRARRAADTHQLTANLGNFIIGDFIGDTEVWGGLGIPILQMCDFYNKITLGGPGPELNDYCPSEKIKFTRAMALLLSQG